MSKTDNHDADVKDGQASGESFPTSVSARKKIRVLVLDLWCYVPYYDRYFCEGLLGVGVSPRLAASSYYLDPTYFEKHNIQNRPGLIDVCARIRLSNQKLRRILMLFETCLNLVALSISITFSKPEILHVQWIPLVQKLPFEIWFLKFAKLRGIRVVYTVHNVLPHDSGQRFKRVYEQVYSEVDMLVCHTQEAKVQLETDFAIKPERICVIPHGPLFHDAIADVQDIRTQRNIGKDVCLVLMQGMLKPYKGVIFLLEAWRQLCSQNLNARLLIVGTADSEFEREIRAKISYLGIKDSVSLDFRYISDEELSSYYQASDIVVYPYKSITASGALMTGLSFQKPIVVTRLPAFQEVLVEGESALFVSFGDVEGFAACLLQLIESPKERSRLAAGAAQIAEKKYSWHSIAKQTKNCYLRVLGQGRRTL